MTTCRDSIESSLRLLGVLAEGETGSAEMMQDSIEAVRIMADSWSIESLSIFTSSEVVYTWPSGVSSRTFGPTGDIVAQRAAWLHPSSYFTVGDQSYPLSVIDIDQYAEIFDKSATSTHPTDLAVSYDMPNIKLTMYPVPSAPVTLHLVVPSALTQPVNLSDTLLFPPGYLRAFKYNLALELAAEFGIEPSPNIVRIAQISKNNIKRLNSGKVLLSTPFGHAGYNIYTDL